MKFIQLMYYGNKLEPVNQSVYWLIAVCINGGQTFSVYVHWPLQLISKPLQILHEQNVIQKPSFDVLWDINMGPKDQRKRHMTTIMLFIIYSWNGA